MGSKCQKGWQEKTRFDRVQLENATSKDQIITQPPPLAVSLYPLPISRLAYASPNRQIKFYCTFNGKN